MEKVTYPAALPGSCYFCGSADREWYIDTKCSVEFHGAMYICNSCSAEIGRYSGFISPVEAQDLKLRNENLEQRAYLLQKQVDHLEGAVRELSAARSVDRPSSQLSFDIPVKESTEVTSDSTGSVGSEQDGTPEPLHDERVDDVPAGDVSADTGFQLKL